MHIKCWHELVRYGALNVLQREYGALVLPQSEPEYNVSLQIDLEQVPTDTGKSLGHIAAVLQVSHHNRESRCLCDVSCLVQTKCTSRTLRGSIPGTKAVGGRE